MLETFLPGLDSFAAAADIRRLRPAARIGILTRHNHSALLSRARQARLNGFVLKQDGFEELNYAIRTMLKGGFYAPPSMSGSMIDPTTDPDPIGCLTEREKSTFALYAQGYVVKEIAGVLNISVKTAETHLNNIRRKLGAPLGRHCWWINTRLSRTSIGAALLDRRGSFRSMSMEFPDSLSLLPHQRRVWAECLGRVINDVRERRGLSAAEAARLSGMDTTQWETIEDGKPTLGTPEQVQAMAETLDIDWGVVRLPVTVLCIPFPKPKGHRK